MPDTNQTQVGAGTLSDTEREQALADVEAVHGRYSIDGTGCAMQLEAPAQTAPDAVEASEEPAAQAA